MGQAVRASVTVAICLSVSCGEPQGSADTTAGGTAHVALPREVAQACNEIAEQFQRSGASVDIRADSFPSLSVPGSRHGCAVRADGALSGRVTIPFLTTALADSLGANWTRDSTVITSGTSGTIYAVKRGEVVCLLQINWQMRVRYDPKAEPPPYSADVGCAKSEAP